MQTDFEFSINGEIHRAGGRPVEYNLGDYLREHDLIPGRNSRSEGQGISGVCSVLMVDYDPRQKAVLRLVNACRMRLPMVAGREILTMDTVAGGEEVDSLQAGLAIAEKLSCNCSASRLPGDSVESNGNNVKTNSGRLALDEEGSFFRATGCLPIHPALNALLQERETAAGVEWDNDVGSADGGRLIPAFAYRDRSGNLFFRPGSLKAALRLLQSHPGASVVAGDTLYPESSQEAVRFTASRQVLVSLEAVNQLRQVSLEGGDWQIGSMVTIRAMVDALHGKFPLIDSMATRFGSLQVRNRSTLGGNLAWSAPDSELATVLLALDAQVVMSSLSGEYAFMLKDCLGGDLRAALGRGEILRSVLLKCPGSTRDGQESCHHLTGFYKVVRRNAGGRAVICAAFVVEINDAGRVTCARLCYGGVASHVMRAHAAEELLAGELWVPEVARRVANSLREAFPARSNPLAGADYRKAMAGELWRKFFVENSTPGKGKTALGMFAGSC